MSQQVREDEAITLHSREAGLMAQYYEGDPFRNYFTYSRRRLDRLLYEYLGTAGGRVLDVGCGTGHHIAQLRSRGFDVSGIDGSFEMVKRARASNPGSVIKHSRVEVLPFPDQSFDAVLCIEVLRYLSDQDSVIREMARVLKPGGYCFATAAPKFNLNGYWLINPLATAFPIPGLKRLRTYFSTSGKLRKQFSAAGFDGIYVQGVCYGPVNWIARLTPGLLPRFLRWWQPFDEKLVSKPWLSNFSNLALVRARKRL